MTDPQPQPDDQLEAYLDGLMNDADRAAFVESLRNAPERRRQVELQARIDGALEQLFQVQTPSREQIAAALAGAVGMSGAHASAESKAAQDSAHVTLPGAHGGRVNASPSGNAPAAPVRGARTYWAAAGLAAAAAIAWVAASLLWNRPDADSPYFAARPLVDVYHDAIASGFEPTYDCREPELFASTFRQRQGQPLRLLAMPPEMRMLGLAYAGGLSRQTTSMLCRVDGEPVMVFVDRTSADSRDAIAASRANSSGGLRVFRDERDGLVFYEVTPFDKARVIQLFAPATGGAAKPTHGA